MTDVRLLPSHVAALFDPRPPLRFVKPVDYPPEKRCTRPIDGMAGVLARLKQDPPAEDEYQPTESSMEKQQREKKLKQEKQKQVLQQRLKEWDPSKDLHVRGDPYKTLFLARLPFKLTDDDLRKELERFGPLERVRIVHDKNGKSRGYAFAVFERERDRDVAKREMRDKLWQGRRILVDLERGRIDSKFRPRSLGGGLGGRHYSTRTEFRDRDGRDRRGPQPRRFDGPRDRPPKFRDGPGPVSGGRPRDGPSYRRDGAPSGPRFRDRDPRDSFSRGAPPPPRSFRR